MKTKTVPPVNSDIPIHDELLTETDVVSALRKLDELCETSGKLRYDVLPVTDPHEYPTVATIDVDLAAQAEEEAMS